MLDTAATSGLARAQRGEHLRHLLLFVVIVGFSLALLTTVSVENVVAAVVLALVAMVWALPLRHVSNRNVDFAWADAGALLRATARLPADATRVGIVLCRAILGGTVRGRGPQVPFRFGTLDDTLERGRRSTAVVAGSLSPDTIVVDIVPGESTATLHRLLPPPDPDRPERLA